MFCSNCGKKIDDNIKFCPDCGQQVEKIENNNVEKVNEKTIETEITKKQEKKRKHNEELICKKCGVKTEEKVKRCPNCGAKLKKPIQRRWWFRLLAGVIILIVIFNVISKLQVTLHPYYRAVTDMDIEESSFLDKMDTSIATSYYFFYDKKLEETPINITDVRSDGTSYYIVFIMNGKHEVMVFEPSTSSMTGYSGTRGSSYEATKGSSLGLDLNEINDALSKFDEKIAFSWRDSMVYMFEF